MIATVERIPPDMGKTMCNSGKVTGSVYHELIQEFLRNVFDNCFKDENADNLPAGGPQNNERHSLLRG